jgi:hypothetical protein
MYAEGWGEGGAQTLLIDVVVCNALAPSVAGSFAAADREIDKLNGPLARCSNSTPDLFYFTPFAVEVLGRLGPLTVEFCKHLAITRRGPTTPSGRSLLPYTKPCFVHS